MSFRSDDVPEAAYSGMPAGRDDGAAMAAVGKRNPVTERRAAVGTYCVAKVSCMANSADRYGVDGRGWRVSKRTAVQLCGLNRAPSNE